MSAHSDRFSVSCVSALSRKEIVFEPSFCGTFAFFLRFTLFSLSLSLSLLTRRARRSRRGWKAARTLRSAPVSAPEGAGSGHATRAKVSAVDDRCVLLMFLKASAAISVRAPPSRRPVRPLRTWKVRRRNSVSLTTKREVVFQDRLFEAAAHYS